MPIHVLTPIEEANVGQIATEAEGERVRLRCSNYKSLSVNHVDVYDTSKRLTTFSQLGWPFSISRAL